MIELHWWGLVLIIILTTIVYSILFVLFYKRFMKGQKGRFLFNLPLAPFSLKSRIYTVSKHLGVSEDEVKYLGNNTYKVNENKYTVEGFFGVTVFHLDDKNNKQGTITDDVSKYNLANLRYESGELEAEFGDELKDYGLATSKELSEEAEAGKSEGGEEVVSEEEQVTKKPIKTKNKRVRNRNKGKQNRKSIQKRGE